MPLTPAPQPEPDKTIALLEDIYDFAKDSPMAKHYFSTFHRPLGWKDKLIKWIIRV